MQFETPVSPHIVGESEVRLIMIDVLLALLPGTLLYCLIFSWAVLLNILIAGAFALASEALILRLRKRPVILTLNDCSALLTAWLFALTLPALLPWWAVAIGIIFSIVVAKHLYGGLGYNPFNPAMAGYVFLLISFPREMTSWIAPRSLAQTSPTFTDIANSVFSSTAIDAFTMATPLGEIKTQLSSIGFIPDFADLPLIGLFGGTGWEWINLAWLLGGVWLIYRKVITWHIPLAMIGSLVVISSAFYILDNSSYLSPLFHCANGAVVFAAFFIATDPVTAPVSQGGKILFAVIIGVLVYIIRSWGGYPDGVAFAVLLMNMAVPSIDYFYRPKAFGQ